MITKNDLQIDFKRKPWTAPERISTDGKYVPPKSGIGYVVTVTNKSGKTINWIKVDLGLVLDGSTSEQPWNGNDGPTYTYHYRHTGVEQFTMTLCHNLAPNGTAWLSVSAADFDRSNLAPTDRWILLRVYGMCQMQPFVFHETYGVVPPPSKILERKDMHCFIAHAAFEDTDHPTVVELRRTRDEVLRKSRTGRRFICFYYRHSPRIAAAMANRPRVRTAARGLLTPLAKGIKCTRATSAFVKPIIKQLFYNSIK